MNNDIEMNLQLYAMYDALIMKRVRCRILIEQEMPTYNILIEINELEERIGYFRVKLLDYLHSTVSMN